MAKGEKVQSTVYGELDSGDVIAAGIWNLHVRITQDVDYWFAQGYEIDYAADGRSLDDVKLRFQCGLTATIREHLRMFGTAAKVLAPAPVEVWQGLTKTSGSSHRYSHVGVYKFEDPIKASLELQGIEYLLTNPETSAV
jgi:hypothetical protein